MEKTWSAAHWIQVDGWWCHKVLIDIYWHPPDTGSNRSPIEIHRVSCHLIRFKFDSMVLIMYDFMRMA